MLVARRDPPFHVDAHDAEPLHSGSDRAPRAPRLARFLTAVQLFGSLLAVPVGIASGYSLYRANFSPETTCQNLRNGIVTLLDKSMDASTRRILVRRDVEAFEKTCGSVDPDATAAFKTLLIAERMTTPVAAPSSPVAPKVQRSEPAPKEAVRKAEPRPQVTAKQPAAVASPVESSRNDPAVSDAQWLDAVRQALASRKPEASAAARPQIATEPPVIPGPREILPAPAPASVPAAASRSAPPLPPAIMVAPPAAQQIDANHPVPPESIPDTVPPPETVKAERPRSQIGKWISGIPLIGPVVNNGLGN